MIAKMPKRVVEQFKVTASRMGMRLKTCVEDFAEKAKFFVAVSGEFPAEFFGFSDELLTKALNKVQPHTPCHSKHNFPVLGNE